MAPTTSGSLLSQVPKTSTTESFAQCGLIAMGVGMWRHGQNTCGRTAQAAQNRKRAKLVGSAEGGRGTTPAADINNNRDKSISRREH